jgi:hypothetical protein
LNISANPQSFGRVSNANLQGGITKQTNKKTNDHHSLGNKDVTPSTGSTIAKKKRIH